MTIKESNSVVPENVNRIIAECGLKKSIVAEKAGYTAMQFSGMLHGRKLISMHDAISISKALNVKIGELFKEGG